MKVCSSRPPSRSTGPRRPALLGISGFTLLELVLVMVIACIALGIAAPSLRGLARGSRGREAAKNIVSLARWARSRAAAEARSYCLRFDPSAGTYSVLAASGASYAPIPIEFGRIFSFPEGYRIQLVQPSGSEPYCIRFYPDGRGDIARIRILGPGVEEVEVAALSPTESYRIVGE